MKSEPIPRAALGRLPHYLAVVRAHADDETISASYIARQLGYGEVLVRRDLNYICPDGRPKIGYPTASLLRSLEDTLGTHKIRPAVIVGAARSCGVGVGRFSMEVE